MEYRKGDVCSFLLHYQVEKGSEYTHTSIVKPAGSFYIPSDKLDDFYAKYRLGVRYNDDLYVTEKHRDISPIVIDLDFRFEKTEKLERVVKEKDIQDIVELYIKHIRHFLDVPEFNVFILQKPTPVVDKNVLKDGVHLIFPDLVTAPSVQYLIRNGVLKECAAIFDKFGLKNGYEDVIDEAVIQRNNWMMFGSRKPNCEKYDITRIVRVDADGILSDGERDPHTWKYIESLSIRNKYDKTKIKIEAEKEVQDFENEEKKKKRKKMDTSVLQTLQNTRKNTYDNLDYVKKLVGILSEARANKYSEWIRTGWCLRTIDYRLLDVWKEFSMKSPKYVDGECDRLWNYMKEDGLGIGTLHMWAKNDNLELYKETVKKDLTNLIFKSKNETHHDVANVIYYMYKYDFVCVSIKQNYWYEFKNHRWVNCDSGFALRAKISTEVCKEYLNSAAYWNQKGSAEDDEGEQQRCGEIAKKLNGIALKLKQTAFKDNIMKECKELFYVNKFEEKLDSRSSLIGFENGVYDLEGLEFREGRPEDYISFTTGIDYIPYNPKNPLAKDVNGFLNTVFTKPHMKEYVLLLLSSFLNGGIKEERFHIWTGVGSNGKSKVVDLFEQSFGEYCCKLPITLLTQKRAASNAATSELARTKGKRFACLQEPSEDEKLNVGLMKELTGGDKIMARLIYKEPIEFKPQFKMILTCNNLPNVPSDDGGTWRRIRVVEFTSRFCDDPDPEKENEFLIDTELTDKFVQWKEYFMSMLIEYYKKYIEKGITEPEEVLQCTKEYQKNNDTFLEFVEQECERRDEDFLSYMDVYGAFKMWCKENNMQMVCTKKRDFIKTISKILGKYVSINKLEGWKGWRFKTSGDTMIDVLDT
jgi:P4 family phage/plasmid primase-like protien